MGDLSSFDFRLRPYGLLRVGGRLRDCTVTTFDYLVSHPRRIWPRPLPAAAHGEAVVSCNSDSLHKSRYRIVGADFSRRGQTKVWRALSVRLSAAAPAKAGAYGMGTIESMNFCYRTPDREER